MTRERDRIQENANKYIVKNCPAFTPQAYEHCCSLDGNYKCEGSTDCVIKQVIDLCNGSIRPNETNLYNAGRMSLAINIKGLFDIEEVRE